MLVTQVFPDNCKTCVFLFLPPIKTLVIAYVAYCTLHTSLEQHCNNSDVYFSVSNIVFFFFFFANSTLYRRWVHDWPSFRKNYSVQYAQETLCCLSSCRTRWTLTEITTIDSTGLGLQKLWSQMLLLSWPITQKTWGPNFRFCWGR